MLYADYARRKMHNVVKLDTKEGYPLTVYNCANKNLKDYTIYGNTVYSENLFNYNTKNNGFTVDRDGWLTVTIDNTNRTSSVRRWVQDRPSELIKPNTTYYLYTEIATFDLEGTPINSDLSGIYAKSELSQTTSNGQFITSPVSLLYTKVGSYKKTMTSREDFSSCSYMLRTFLTIAPGLKITVKFRIAVYETQKDEFIPYSKQSVGNLITDETSEYYNKYKIPILVNGNEAAVIYRDAPLAGGESINYKSDNLPDITLEKGTNTITANTEVKPSSIKIKYLKK